MQGSEENEAAFIAFIFVWNGWPWWELLWSQSVLELEGWKWRFGAICHGAREENIGELDDAMATRESSWNLYQSGGTNIVQ